MDGMGPWGERGSMIKGEGARVIVGCGIAGSGSVREWAACLWGVCVLGPGMCVGHGCDYAELG